MLQIKLAELPICGQRQRHKFSTDRLSDYAQSVFSKVETQGEGNLKKNRKRGKCLLAVLVLVSLLCPKPVSAYEVDFQHSEERASGTKLLSQRKLYEWSRTEADHVVLFPETEADECGSARKKARCGSLTVAEYENERQAKQMSDQSAGAEVNQTITLEESWNDPTRNAAEATCQGLDFTDFRKIGKYTVVAVIDTGVDPADPRIPILKHTFNPSPVGTHGSVAARAVCAAGGENIKILPFSVFDEDGKTSVLRVYQAMEQAIAQSVDVILLSVSGPGISAALSEAVTDAVDQGIFVVAAAGNGGENVLKYMPANIDEAIVVSAVDEQGCLEEYSNYGPSVDFCALGSYEGVEGTSIAAARVAGEIAKELNRGESLSYREVYRKLQQKAAAARSDDPLRYGYGVLSSGVNTVFPREETDPKEVERCRDMMFEEYSGLMETALKGKLTMAASSVTVTRIADLKAYLASAGSCNIYLGTNYNPIIGSQLTVAGTKNVYMNGTTMSISSKFASSEYVIIKVPVGTTLNLYGYGTSKENAYNRGTLDGKQYSFQTQLFSAKGVLHVYNCRITNFINTQSIEGNGVSTVVFNTGRTGFYYCEICNNTSMYGNTLQNGGSNMKGGTLEVSGCSMFQNYGSPIGASAAYSTLIHNGTVIYNNYKAPYASSADVITNLNGGTMRIYESVVMFGNVIQGNAYIYNNGTLLIGKNSGGTDVDTTLTLFQMQDQSSGSTYPAYLRSTTHSSFPSAEPGVTIGSKATVLMTANGLSGSGGVPVGVFQRGGTFYNYGSLIVDLSGFVMQQGGEGLRIQKGSFYQFGTLQILNGSQLSSHGYGVYNKDRLYLYSENTMLYNNTTGLYNTQTGQVWFDAGSIHSGSGSGIENAGNVCLDGGNIMVNGGYGIRNTGTVIHKSGEILANTQGGIYQCGTYQMSGSARVDYSNVIRLAKGHYVEVTDALTLNGICGRIAFDEPIPGTIAVYASYGGRASSQQVGLYGGNREEARFHLEDPNYVMGYGDWADQRQLEGEALPVAADGHRLSDSDKNKYLFLSVTYPVTYFPYAVKEELSGFSVLTDAQGQWCPIQTNNMDGTKYWCENLILTANAPGQSEENHQFEHWFYLTGGQRVILNGFSLYQENRPLNVFAAFSVEEEQEQIRIRYHYRIPLAAGQVWEELMAVDTLERNGQESEEQASLEQAAYEIRERLKSGSVTSSLPVGCREFTAVLRHEITLGNRTGRSAAVDCPLCRKNSVLESEFCDRCGEEVFTCRTCGTVFTGDGNYACRNGVRDFSPIEQANAVLAGETSPVRYGMTADSDYIKAPSVLRTGDAQGQICLFDGWSADVDLKRKNSRQGVCPKDTAVPAFLFSKWKAGQQVILSDLLDEAKLAVQIHAKE